MAISSKDCKLLFYSKSIGCSFEKTLMLGRLKLYASSSDIAHCLSKYQMNSSLINQTETPGGYSESLFKTLGAAHTESLDYSDYEGATLIHDMNTPIDKSQHSKFTAIVDGGTLEHVFNFPVAIKNCMNMLEVGGHFIGMSPANNQMGHGFYQFSPELYYRIFSKENGFIIRKMFITPPDTGAWYEVADPASVKSRVMLMNQKPLSLMILAQKIESSDVFKSAPQQSDYQTVWHISQALKKDIPVENESHLKFLYRKFVPKPLKLAARYLYDLTFLRKKKSEELGTYNSDHFKKIEM